jgi:hypothetical protein
VSFSIPGIFFSFYENSCIHRMEDTFPLGGHYPQHGKDRGLDHAPEGSDGRRGRLSRPADDTDWMDLSAGTPSFLFEIRSLYRTRRHSAIAPEPEGGSENKQQFYDIQSNIF